ncbi:MAG: molybdopterin-binding protein, partial [Negativicutes bacterium]|nr:molybdopterin-binding protein [Negativicutes bacterium]
GTPVLPGAMFLVAYLGQKPILGIPACGMFSKITILDVVLPKVLLGERISRRYIASLGHGGLCQTCPGECRFPGCSFCK